jgi:hypothetical protein
MRVLVIGDIETHTDCPRHLHLLLGHWHWEHNRPGHPSTFEYRSVKIGHAPAGTILYCYCGLPGDSPPPSPTRKIKCCVFCSCGRFANFIHALAPGEFRKCFYDHAHARRLHLIYEILELLLELSIAEHETNYPGRFISHFRGF